MSDDDLLPDHELANAYLDGHASAQERAAVEASPELLALVASYRALRARVAQVPPPSAAHREAAVAAALAAMPVVAPLSNVVSLAQRRRSRVLSAAAAVVLLGVAGVAVSKAFTGSDSASTAGGNAASSQNIAGNKLAPTGSEAGASDVAANTVAGGAGGAATETTAAGGFADTTAAASEITAIGGVASGVPALSTTGDLQALHTAMVSRLPVVPNFFFDCPLASSQVIEAEITWQGTPAVAVRDTVSGVISVLSPDCTELVAVPSQP